MHSTAIHGDGRSALEQQELLNVGIKFFLRERNETSVLHALCLKAGKVPNVIPDGASVWLWIRDSNAAV